MIPMIIYYSGTVFGAGIHKNNTSNDVVGNG